MADLTIPLIALTGMFGYFLSKKQRVETLSTKIEPNELPTESTIYTSNRVYDAEKDVYEELRKNYVDSMDPENTNVIPPIYNTYATRGTEKFDYLNVNDNKSVAQWNEFQRLANVKSKSAPERNISSAPMFKSLTEVKGHSRDSEVYTAIENLNGREVSLLTGESLDKRHNNMVPFFGGTVKQNIENFTNKTTLDLYTGEEDTYIKKHEIASLQDKVQENIYGSPVFTTQIEKDRFIPSYFRNNETPAEREYISAPIAGTGDNKIRSSFRDTNELRVKNNPKLVYKARHNTGQIASVRGAIVPVEKRRPERVWEWGQDRWNKTTGEYTGYGVYDNFENMKHTNRQSAIGYYGGVNNVKESYIPIQPIEQCGVTCYNGSKRSQFLPEENAYRNVNTLGPTNDYGKSSQIVPETQRDTTFTTHVLNANRQGYISTAQHQDQAKGTIKESTEVRPYLLGGQISTDFNGGRVSAMEAGVAGYQARTNQKESTVKNKYEQGIRHRDYGMGYNTTTYTVGVTNKEITSTNPKSDYRGVAKELNGYESRTSVNNMEMKTNQETLISNERANGPQKFQINLGRDGYSEPLTRENKLLSEQSNTVKLNIDSRKSAPGKELIGETEVRTSFPEYSRIDTEILKQLDNNPFVNENLRAY